VGGSIRLWEVATGKPVAIPGADHPLVSAAALSPDGTTFVWGGSDGKLHFCDRSGKEVRTASVSRLPVSSVVFAPDGKTVVATDQDGTSVRVIDVATGRRQHTLAAEACGTPPFAYSSDGKLLAILTLDRIGVYQPATLKSLREIHHEAQAFTCVAFAPDGR